MGLGGLHRQVPLTLIRGVYRLSGAAPDGHSLRFTPNDPAVWVKAGVRARVNATGGAQLRLDAVDGLEMRYSPRSSPLMWRQPADLALKAADRLLALLGFTDVQRSGNGTVVAASPQERPGFILCRFADVHGRPVAIAYPDDAGLIGLPGTGQPDGSSLWLNVSGLRPSVNYQLLAQGLVYPTFYGRLYVELREAFAAAAAAARQAGQGVWQQDATTAGFTVLSRQHVTDGLVVLPKLFRRLADYLVLQDPDDVDLAGFGAFLAARDDRLVRLPEGQVTSLDTLVRIADQHVRLTAPPDRIVFLER